MSDERVSVTVEAGIASVRLNRPGKLNAIDHAMFTALSEASAAVAARADARVVVLSGSGRGFCAGLDIASLAGAECPSPSSGGPMASRTCGSTRCGAGGSCPSR